MLVCLVTLSLVHICRKNRGFSSSDGCKRMPRKLKYGTNIRLLSKRYKLIYIYMPLEDISFSSHIHALRGNQLRLTRSACLNKIRPIYLSNYLSIHSITSSRKSHP